MKHPILDYWEVAFTKHRIGEHAYFSEAMPDPILSPRFLTSTDGVTQDLPHFNLIQAQDATIPTFEGFRLRNNFALCRMKIRSEPADFAHTIEPLEITASLEAHQALLNDGFPQDFEFLKGLERFLPSLNATYLVGTIYHSTTPVASVTIGITGHIAVLISGTVHSQFRDQKLSRKIRALVHHIGSSNGVEEIFYWTKSDRLTVYADQIDRYLVYVRL